MRQALHIFKKDVRYLWYEIAVTLALVAMVAVGQIRASTDVWEGILAVLLPIAWVYLIARAIYAEPLRGDRLFWITRPYGWKNLLGAKALFILVFVNLPLLLAHAIILSANGFPLIESLPGLLWSQIILAGVIAIPVVAVATVTTGFVQLLLTSLIIFVCWMFYSLLQFQFSAVSWQGLEWIKASFVIGTVTVAGLIMVLWQYSRRRAAIACSVAVVEMVLGLVGSARFPWTRAFVLQSWLSKRPIDVAMVRIRLDSDRATRVSSWGPQSVKVELPIRIAGLPDGMEVRADNISLTAEGFRWITRALRAILIHRAAGFELEFLIDRGSYERLKDQPGVTLRTSFYLTLLGNPRNTTVQQGAPVAVPGVGRCAVLAEVPALFCRTAFGNVLDSVSLQPAPDQSFMVAQPISYSPYPAQFSISPVSQHIYDLRGSPARVVIVSEEPLMHFHMDAEFRDVRLRISQ